MRRDRQRLQDVLDAIAAMRNQLVHGYFQVDWSLVWRAVERDVPLLKVTVSRLLAETPDD